MGQNEGRKTIYQFFTNFFFTNFYQNTYLNIWVLNWVLGNTLKKHLKHSSALIPRLGFTPAIAAACTWTLQWGGEQCRRWMCSGSSCFPLLLLPPHSSSLKCGSPIGCSLFGSICYSRECLLLPWPWGPICCFWSLPHLPVPHVPSSCPSFFYPSLHRLYLRHCCLGWGAQPLMQMCTAQWDTSCPKWGSVLSWKLFAGFLESTVSISCHCTCLGCSEKPCRELLEH